MQAIVELWMDTDVSALIIGPIVSICSLALFLHMWFILVIFGAYDHMKEELVYPGPPAIYDEPTLDPPTTPKRYLTMAKTEILYPKNAGA